MDYYQILGVKKDAGDDEIKRAYRKLVRKYHPDVNKDKDADAKMGEINNAYETLKDPQKRAQYDAMQANPFGGQDFGGQGFGQQGFGGFSGFGGQGFSAEGFADIFSAFGMGGMGSRARTAKDSESTMHISLQEAVLGGEKTLLVDGERVSVKIPKQIQSGKKLRVRGKGAHGGDLLLKVVIDDSENAKLVGSDVVQTVQAMPWQLWEGGALEFSAFDGTSLKVNIPPRTNSGAKLRLKGKGLGGDLIVRLQVHLPTPSTDAQIQALQALKDAYV